MPIETKDFSLGFLAEGGTGELFDREVEKVVANMRDPNTDPKAKRVITLKITISPDRDRSGAKYSAQTTAKLAPSEPLAQQIYLGKRGDKVVAVAHDPGQRSMFDDEKADPSVLPLKPTEEAQG